MAGSIAVARRAAAVVVVVVVFAGAGGRVHVQSSLAPLPFHMAVCICPPDALAPALAAAGQ